MIKAYVLFRSNPVKVTGLEVELEGVAAAPSRVKEYEVAPSAAVQATVIWLVVAAVCEIPVTAAGAVDMLNDDAGVDPNEFTLRIIKGYVVFADRPVKVTEVDVEVDGVAADPFNVKEYEVAPRAAVQLTVI